MMSHEELLRLPHLTADQRWALKNDQPLHGNTKCHICGCKRSKLNRVRLSLDTGKPICDNCWDSRKE